MQSKPHFFLGLRDAAEARMVPRRSFLIEAKSFRVGIFSNSFRLPFSMRGVL